MKKTFLFMPSFFVLMAIANQSCARSANDSTSTTKNDTTAKASLVKPDADNAGLKLPQGFGALKVTDGLGEARHLAVTPQGDIYVKLSSLKNGKGIYFLHDANGDGKIDTKTSFGSYTGTGMFIKNGYLYASSDKEVFRYKLDANNKVTNPDKPEKIVTGLLSRGEHEAKAITLDNDGNLYVNIGAYSNICQQKDRVKGSPGMKPCPILDSAGGIWQFNADKLNQTYGDDTHYATGLRNVVGLDWNTATNSLFVMQHGRDQLQDYTDLFSQKEAVELPAECLYELHKGSNCGWPYIYYDPIQHKKILRTVIKNKLIIIFFILFACINYSVNSSTRIIGNIKRAIRSLR